VLRLIRMSLKAGVMEDGLYTSTATGIPQGGTISPLLSSIYGHALLMRSGKRRRHTLVCSSAGRTTS
jgi:retron-type reverse transcriptase